MAPNKASNTILRFAHCPNDSDSGAFDTLPEAFISWNTGDSCSCRRMYAEMNSSTIESRNGTRQPQASNCSGLIEKRHPRMTSRERKKPSVAVVWIQLV